MLLRATRFGHLRRRILSWCRRTRISASNAARGRNSPIKAHQINLQRSLIDRTINRFASTSQLFEFAVGTADQIRAHHQPEDREGTRPRRAADGARPRRRSDRMMGWMAPLRHRRAKLVFWRITRNREPSMSEITTIGLDVAKHVFQLHGVNAEGTTVLRKWLRRGQVLAVFSRLPRCLVGLEACATAQYWARELGALGHEVRLMPAQYVKAYVKRNKNDAADAEAICEAVQRPTMRFVPIKTAEQQAAQLLHRGR